MIIKWRCIIGSLTILFLTSSVSLAQLQPSSPHTLETSHEEQKKPEAKQADGNNKQRVADSLPTPTHPQSSDVKASDHAKTIDEKATTEWLKLVFDFLLVLFNCLLWRSTYKLWKVAQEQREDVKASIAEAVRSTAAMESIAKSMAENGTRMEQVFERQKNIAEIQLRAYLTVNPGTYWIQNRELGLKYGIQMLIANTGHTPASEVYFAMRTVVNDFPLPDSFDLSLPSPRTQTGTGAQIATGQQRFMSAFLDDIVSDEELKEFTQATNRKLYIFGTVWYKDIFEESHYTNFCQWAMWDTAGKFSTINVDRHNDAT